jgi:SAM-dependent methyltransferase
MRLAERGFEVEGIDHSQAMLDKEKVRARGFEDRVRLRTGDVRALPFDDASFDLVTCTGVLHHLPEIRTCLAEAARVLRPAGVLCITEPCRQSNRALRARERHVRPRLPKRPPPAESGVPDPVRSEERLEVPDHDEGPIDAEYLADVLRDLRMETELTYGRSSRGCTAWLRSDSRRSSSSRAHGRGAAAAGTWSSRWLAAVEPR